MTTKNATPADLVKIASCHVEAFPDSVTSLMGISFVAKMLEWYLSAPNKFLYWIEEDGECIGYCGGYVRDSSDSFGSATGMSQFGLNEAFRVVLRKPWLLFHPEIISRYKFIISNLKRRFTPIKNKTTHVTPQPHIIPIRTAGLVVIGVRKNKMKKGIGSLLQIEFEKRAKALNAEIMQLSVRKTNESAIASYKRNGWYIDSEQPISYLMKKKMQ
jgi:ribosomal protein S18 acetylase RimI-like enzyme